MKSFLRHALALAAFTAATSISAHADVVQDGTFQDGYTYWTVSPATNHPWSISTGYASTGCVGDPCINGAAGQTAELYQSVSLVAGDSYTLSFNFAFAGDYGQELVAKLGTTTAIDLNEVASNPSDSDALLPYSISGLVATSGTEELLFLGRQDPGYDTLENVSLVDNGPAATGATPEPSSLVLLGTGALSLAGAARRKFRKA